MNEEAARVRARQMGMEPKGLCWRYPAMVNKQPRGEGCGEHTDLAAHTVVVIRGDDLHYTGANGVRAMLAAKPLAVDAAHSAGDVPDLDPRPNRRPHVAPEPEPEIEVQPEDAGEAAEDEPTGQDEALAHFRAQKPNAKRRAG